MIGGGDGALASLTVWSSRIYASRQDPPSVNKTVAVILGYGRNTKEAWRTKKAWDDFGIPNVVVKYGYRLGLMKLL